MALFNGTHKDYYKGNNFGNYQFISLQDVITQFEIAYVGEDKIIPKIKRADIAFFAQRALQELSFDVFKSIKSQQIEVPATLVMPLPHDYVNYTEISSVDTSGIKHTLYPTKHTSNPFQILQDDNGLYEFPQDQEKIINGDFAGDLFDTWSIISAGTSLNANFIGGTGMNVESGKLTASFHTTNGYSAYNWGHVNTAYQLIDVSDVDYLTVSGDGIADIIAIADTATSSDADNVGVLRLGVSTQVPEDNYINNTNNATSNASAVTSNNINTSIFDLQDSNGNASYAEWLGPNTAGQTSSTQEINDIDVRGVNQVYVVIVSYVDFNLSTNAQVTSGNQTAIKFNSIDNVSAKNGLASTFLQSPPDNVKNSSTWQNYKSITPSEINNNDDYEDDTYWPYDGNRYGLEPSHAQVNGSFYIDPRLGRIHFSSNISGKTVILDYISDSLGTDEEMQVHKFAEEAMYKHIAHAILSTSSNPLHQNLSQRFKREKFAAVRTAKIRLSNLKIEELTQILRGKSKHIKH